MLESPVKVNDYKSISQKFREERPEMFLGDTQTYIKGFKYEKDRVKEQFDKNQDLDYFPNQTVYHYNFRERQMDKEIQQDMRFTAKTSLERIQAHINDHMQTQVENIDFRDQKRTNKDKSEEEISLWDNDKVITAGFRKRAMLAREIAKNLLPSLHNKTHFQAAQTMFNNQASSIVDKNTLLNKKNYSTPALLDESYQKPKSQPQSKASLKIKPAIKNVDSDKVSSIGKVVSIVDHKDIHQSLEHKILQQKSSDQMETFNPLKASEQVLFECNVIRHKNPKVKYIHPGEGHLSGLNDMSISEIYEQLNLKQTSHSFHKKLPNLNRNKSSQQL